jgi:hypothetical protein
MLVVVDVVVVVRIAPAAGVALAHIREGHDDGPN